MDRALPSREQLLVRKTDLFAALRLLQQDQQDGVIDEAAYRAARERYEQEAAEVLEQLDSLVPVETEEPVRPARWRPRARHVRAAGAACLVAVALVLYLVSAVHPRGAGQSITGDVPTAAPVPTLPPAVAAAQRTLSQHPHSYSALVALGNAYLKSANVKAADQAYLAAVNLDPTQPEAATLHALILGSIGHYNAALDLLRQIESHHPTYARAWLLDGMLASHSPSGYRRAVASWRRFLALQPHAAAAPRVRAWIASAQQAEKTAG